MDSPLYIRVRGRVLGPYDQEKLQSLARRGQLSRMHELSADGASWSRASNYPELFVGDPVEMPADRHSAAALEPVQVVAVDDGAFSSPQGRPQSPQQWHYTSAGVQRGPIDFANLQLLCATGQLRSDDLVWSDGMAAWIPASQLPGLFISAASQTNASSFDAGAAQRSGSQDAVPDRLWRSAHSSRSWVIFIAIAVCVYAVLDAIGGMWFLLLGARVKSIVGVAYGIFTLLGALDWAIGAYLLNVYISRMGSLQYSRTPIVLEKVHDALRTFWIYVAINLIILLVFIGFVVVWVFAAGITLPM